MSTGVEAERIDRSLATGARALLALIPLLLVLGMASTADQSTRVIRSQAAQHRELASIIDLPGR